MLLTILPFGNIPKPDLADRSIKPIHFDKHQNIGEEPKLPHAFHKPILPLATELWPKKTFFGWLESIVSALSSESKKHWNEETLNDIVEKYIGSRESFHIEELSKKLKFSGSLKPDLKLLQRAMELAKLRVPDLETAKKIDSLGLISRLHLTEPSLLGDAQWSTGKARFMAYSLMMDVPNKGFLRLHFYPSALQSSEGIVQDGEDHSHYSNGIGWIIKGGLVNQMSECKVRNFETGESIFHNDTKANYSSGLVNSGKSVDVQVKSRYFYEAGECYGFPSNKLHRVANIDPTITMFYFTETKDPIQQKIIYSSNQTQLQRKPDQRKEGLTSEYVLEQMQAIDAYIKNGFQSS